MSADKYPHLTEEKLKNIIEEVFFKEKEKISFANNCIEKGLVARTNLNLNLCNNSECSNCRELENAIKGLLE